MRANVCVHTGTGTSAVLQRNIHELELAHDATLVEIKQLQAQLGDAQSKTATETTAAATALQSLQVEAARRTDEIAQLTAQLGDEHAQTQTKNALATTEQQNLQAEAARLRDEIDSAQQRVSVLETEAALKVQYHRRLLWRHL